jgi:hypothetical protein
MTDLRWHFAAPTADWYTCQPERLSKETSRVAFPTGL